MTVEDQIGYLQARVATLEAKLASLASQGDDQIVEGGLHASPQPTVDLKGRKIWEAEWRGDYGVLLAYVPDNALVIDGKNIEIYADDKDGDEVTVTEGSWYLHIYKNEGGEGYTADFDDSATGSRDGETAKCNIRIFDIHEDGYVEKQYVVGSIVLGGGEGGGSGGDKYYGDDRSVTLQGQSTTDPTQMFSTNYFHLYGFGRFTADGYANPIGTYQPATDLELDTNSDESTNVAFICRTGNSSSPDTNFIQYRKLKFKNGGASSPFNYEKTKVVNPDTHEEVTLHKIVNCKFYWQGEIQELQDFDVSGIAISGGSVFLVGKQPAPSTSNPDPDWTWELATTAGQAPSGGKVLNFQLWEFADGKPSVDFRTTFLSLEDTTQKARIEIKRPNGTGSIVLDSTGDKPKVVVSDGSGKSCTIDLSQIPETCEGGKYGFHSIQYKDKNGDTQIYHGLFCDDIDLTEMQSEGKTIKFIDYSTTTTGTMVYVIYTDDTQDEFFVQRGPKGEKGDKGSVEDAVWTRSSHVRDVTFEIKDGNLVAHLYYTSVSVPNWSGAEPEDDPQPVDKVVCTVEELEVVTKGEYSTSDHKFTNKRKKIKVLGTQDVTDETAFTATPHSNEV